MTCRAAMLAGLLLAVACNSTTKTTPASHAAEATPAEKPKPIEPSIPLPALPKADPRETAIAIGVRELLQTEHVGARAVDDDISRKACERFIKHLDPGKLFLLKPQVEELRRRADRLDDQLASGELPLARLGGALVIQQRAKVATMVAELLEKPFDFSKPDFLETDADKREFAATDAELRDLWRLNLKRQVIERVSRMRRASEKRAEAEKKKADGKKQDSGKDKGKDKDEDKKKVREEPLPTTDEARDAKARKDLATTYAGRFSRLAKPEPLEDVETFVNAITSVFDPHTLYMAPAEQANFDIQMSGSLEGIGAVLTEDDHYIEVREVVPGGAAWRQGELEAGDLIMSVQQEGEKPVDVADMRLNDVVKIIRGPKGTLVTLSVQKPDDRVLSIPITRDVIVVEASYARGALLDLGEQHPPVGYIFLPSFYGNTRSAKGLTPERDATGDVKALLELFSKKKVGGVILDLRGNGGGLLNHARDITGLFIEKGPVVQARGSNERMQILSDDDPSIVFKGDVVTLVDRFSASASEILAGALQDYGRSLIVGTGPTHGKGTVQMLVDLGRVVRHKGKPLGVLKLTVQQFFLVDGESTQQRGVQPDIVLPDPASYVESGERYLDDAIPWSSVKPLPHTPWTATRWDTAALNSQSQARQAQRPVFAAIQARGAHLKKRSEDTRIPLERKAWEARREADEKALEELDPKLDEQPSRFAVEVVEYRPTKPQAEGDARQDTGERIKQWREGLARDPWIEEGLHLLQDMATAGGQ